MWYKLFLLLLYFLFLFALARLLEIVSWYRSGVWCHTILDPVSLSVSRLKAILETRGIGYEGAVEKHDFSQLVEATGVTTGEDLSLQLEEDEGLVTNFTHGLHFLEEVEDKKDSVWLVQVKTDQWPGSPLTQRTWSAVRKKLARFGIRAGVFDCRFDYRLCTRKGWSTPRLILALPQGMTTKGNVSLYKYDGRTNERNILNWVKDKMAVGITEIKDYDDLQNNWLSQSSDNGYEIRTIFFAKLAVLPLLFTALSFKFPGRVRFAVAGPKLRPNDGVDNDLDVDSELDVVDNELEEYKTSYIVRTHDEVYSYGLKPGEVFAFKKMEIFLKSMYPETNDLFLMILFISNWLSWLECVLCRGGVIRRIMRLLWYLIKYNVIVIVTLLPTIALFRLPYMDRIVLLGLKGLQNFGTTTLSAFLRKDFDLFRTDVCLFLSATALFSITVGLFEYVRLRDTEEPTSDQWFDLTNFMTSNYLISPLTNLAPFGLSVYPDDTRQIELVNDTMAQPSLWLRPSIDPSYMRSLATWTYSEQVYVKCCRVGCSEKVSVKPDADDGHEFDNPTSWAPEVGSCFGCTSNVSNNQKAIPGHAEYVNGKCTRCLNKKKPPPFDSKVGMCQKCGKERRPNLSTDFDRMCKKCLKLFQLHDLTSTVWSYPLGSPKLSTCPSSRSNHYPVNCNISAVGKGSGKVRKGKIKVSETASRSSDVACGGGIVGLSKITTKQESVNTWCECDLSRKQSFKSPNANHSQPNSLEANSSKQILSTDNTTATNNPRQQNTKDGDYFQPTFPSEVFKSESTFGSKCGVSEVTISPTAYNTVAVVPTPDVSPDPVFITEPVFPAGFLSNQNCVICLEAYGKGDGLCGLPCGHSFHDKCVFAWLSRDHHFCPVCRWPSYKQKLPSTHLHSE